MKRLNRRFWAWLVVAIISSVLSIASLAGWRHFEARSYVTGITGRTWSMGIQMGERGCIFFGVLTTDMSLAPGYTPAWTAPKVVTFRNAKGTSLPTMVLFFTGPLTSRHTPELGTRLVGQMSLSPPAESPITISINATGLSLPLYELALLFLLIAAFAVWRCRRARGFGPGMCAKCGYDLRASSERCPECGAARSDIRDSPAGVG